MNIELVHAWTKERVSLAVEYYDAKIVSVRWPLAGTYDLNLKTNEMKARSPQARRKNPYCLWRAADIVKVRREVWGLLNPDHKEREDAYQRHQEWIVSQGMVKKCESETPKQTSPRKPSMRRTRL